MKSSLDAGRWRVVGNLLTLGVVMGACVGLGALGGLWLDRRLGTSPWLALLGVILGAIAAFREVLRVLTLARERGRQ
jgi:ATP synthase protein I